MGKNQHVVMQDDRWVVKEEGATPPIATFKTQGQAWEKAKAIARRERSEAVLHGKDGIRTAFTRLLSDVPNANWDLKTLIYEGDGLFLEWAADAGATFADDGIDTFVFRDGLIRVQTLRYTLQHRG